MAHVLHRIRDWWSRDAGNNVLEVVIIVPAMILILGLCVAGGSVAIAHQRMEHVAEEAARAASVARTPGQATAAATQRALQVFATTKGLTCATSSVTVDTSQFLLPPGIPASVTATVHCTVILDALGYLGIHGTRNITATATSPIDTYRERLR